LNERKFEDAKPSYEKALALDPKNAQLMAKLSRCYFNSDDFEKAYKYAEQAIEIDPTRFEAWVILGNRDYERDRYRDAEIKYNNALNNNPDYPFAYYNIALIYFYRDFKKAENYFQKAIQCAKNYYLGYVGLAELYKENNRLEEAYNLYKQAIAINPKVASIYISYAELLFQDQKYGEADNMCQKAALCDPLLPYEQNRIIKYYKQHPLYESFFEKYSDEQLLHFIRQDIPIIDELVEIIRNRKPLPPKIEYFPWFNRYQDLLTSVCEKYPSHTATQLLKKIEDQSLLKTTKIWM
jgi:tetratricopeptide (TPR) repeat protein